MRFGALALVLAGLGWAQPVIAWASPPTTAVCENHRPGCLVLFHDVEGHLIAQVRAGEDGEASHPLPSGGMVTVLVEGGSEAGGPAFYTVTEVEPGEVIFAAPTEGPPKRAPNPEIADGISRARVIGIADKEARVAVEHAMVSQRSRFRLETRNVVTGPLTELDFDAGGAESEDYTLSITYPLRAHTTISRITHRRPFLPDAAPIELDMVRDLLPLVNRAWIEDTDPERPFVCWELEGPPSGADAIALIVTWDTRGGEWAIMVPPEQRGTIRLPETPPTLADLGPARRVIYNAVDVAVLDASSIDAYDSDRRTRGMEATAHDEDRSVRASLWLQKQGIHAPRE